MMRTFMFLAALCIWPWAAHAQGGVDPDYYKVMPYRIGKIAKLTITSASQKSDYDEAEDCRSFVMTPALIRDFFRHARPVSEAARMHEYDFSSCQAEGKVRFANGDEAAWLIWRGGTGLMLPSNGKFKGKKIYLHCLKCEDWDE